MQYPSTLTRHAALVDRMATTRGVDLQEQALRGNVSTDEITDAVLSCTNCTNPEGCSDWLGRQNEPVAQSPSYCRNTPLFDHLTQT